MKFAVYGNCQAAGFGASIRSFLPGSTVTVSNAAMTTDFPDPRQYDLLFCHPNFMSRFESTKSHNLRPFPIIVFTGFHPDSTYLLREKQATQSPIGAYHSALVAACFVLGVPAEDVASYLDSARFAAIGYLAEFERAKTFLLKSAQSSGFDLRPLVDDWMRRGAAFMYTVNHPQLYVLRDICRLALAKEGLAAELDEATVPPDGLARGNWWPVYQIVAQHLGIAEQPLFKYPAARAEKEGKSALSFDEFAVGSYRIYRELPRQVITETPQVARLLKALGEDRAGAA